MDVETLYLVVTNDEYEFILDSDTNVTALAKRWGVKTSTIYKTVQRSEQGLIKGEYRRVSRTFRKVTIQKGEKTNGNEQ